MNYVFYLACKVLILRMKCIPTGKFSPYCSASDVERPHIPRHNIWILTSIPTKLGGSSAFSSIFEYPPFHPVFIIVIVLFIKILHAFGKGMGPNTPLRSPNLPMTEYMWFHTETKHLAKQNATKTKRILWSRYEYFFISALHAFICDLLYCICR